MLSTFLCTVGSRCITFDYFGASKASATSFNKIIKLIVYPAFGSLLHVLYLNSPTQEAYFNTASPPTRVSRASPRPEGFIPRAVFKTPGRQAAALARRQEHYAEFDATTDAFAKADTQEDVSEVFRISVLCPSFLNANVWLTLSFFH